MVAGNERLMARAGNNVGMVTAWFPRVIDGVSAIKEIPVGSDLTLFEGPDADDGILATSQIDLFNTGAVAPLTGELVLESPNGLQHVITGFTVAAPVAPSETAQLALFFPLTLTKGEKLKLRILTGGYVGGCIAEGSAGHVYGGFNIREAIDTSLKTIATMPPGKGVGATFGGGVPSFFIINSDSIAHLIDLYVSIDDGPDLLVVKGFNAPSPALTPVAVFMNSLPVGAKLKAKIREPIATAGRSVVIAAFYILYDGEAI